jgi:acetyl-CoA carboxylase biotin carboxyl carrier protein
MRIDENAIRKLAELLDETGLTEIEVAEGEKAIRVSRNATVVAGGAVVQGGSQKIAMHHDPTVPQQANLDAPSTVTQDHPGAVTSPMVGTAYTASDPGSPPFVRKGDSVKEGDTLLIIEAMKVMNPIKAHRSGTVKQVLVENAQPVEYGDVLMVIE